MIRKRDNDINLAHVHDLRAVLKINMY